MDNQFSPNKPSTDGFQPPAQQPAPPEPTAVEAPAPAPASPVKTKKSKKGKWLVGLIIVLLLAAVAGVYYWQSQEVQKAQDQNAALTKELNQTKAQLQAQTQNAEKAKAAASTVTVPKTSSTSDNIITGEVADKATTTATLNGAHKSGNLTAIWVEYGTDPTALSKATEHNTKGLGEGAPNTYVDEAFKVTGLTAGTRYFYRVAATENGKTVYGGVASFTSAK
jgi:cytoskeletal protein RodZ